MESKYSPESAGMLNALYGTLSTPELKLAEVLVAQRISNYTDEELNDNLDEIEGHKEVPIYYNLWKPLLQAEFEKRYGA